MSESSELYEKILSYLRENGWIKGNIYSRQSACTVGAYALVTNQFQELNYHKWCSELPTLTKIIQEQYPEVVSFSQSILGVGFTIVDFNDHPDTTFEDVEKVLEKAIVECST